MQFIEKSIREYLDALTHVHGEAYTKKAVVDHRGGAQIFVKYPGHAEGMLVNLGTLELMTRNLLERAAQAA
ncbi:hypothetical protein FE236_10950 [Mariprofundus erugo]|uniref:Uncharacterized protein n=1 Tax=Mariprofundus erugo TaxID=2528639 RepID=A0A5R9GU71_9PROT|nr:hypothetical protein [Mariprofundus erugo]TLS67602.1 hypothetical protein FEF65_06730 [Mariprofundus erugo]TLS74805.1 hypothetical protein FE236_10950 [Mariprofundus erugo]